MGGIVFTIMHRTSKAGFGRCAKPGNGVKCMFTAGELKQEILRIYNAINKQVFSVGVRQQHVDFVGNKILILSSNTRTPILRQLSESHAEIIRQMDCLLTETFKQLLAKALKEQLQLHILTLFKDYDAVTELSGTVVVLDRDVSVYHD